MSDYRFNKLRKMITPAVGDAEIRAVRFEFPDLLIDLFDPQNLKETTFRLSRIRSLYFETDLPQIVVENVYVFDLAEKGIANIGNELKGHIDSIVPKSDLRNLKVVVIECIAGGPLIAYAQDFEVV